MERAQQAEGAENSESSSRPKRSRTGCLTCRTRRRKCDEGKPLCNNCVTKGFECRYGEAFQILGKNNFTPDVGTSVKYTNLRFVSRDGEKQSSSKSEVDTDQDSALNTKAQTPSITAPPIATTSSSTEQHTLNEQPTLNTQQTTSLPSQSSPTVDNYEFALHGLLALGGGAGVNSGHVFSPSTSRVESFNSGANQNVTDRGSFMFEPQYEDHSVGRHRNEQGWALIDLPEGIGSEVASQERHLELLQHYRYAIAPWLDIYDVSQTFGCEVLQLSADSQLIRYGLLALAETTFSSYDSTSFAIRFEDLNRSRRDNLGIVREALLIVLTSMKDLITDVDTYWLLEKTVAGFDLVETLLPEIDNSSLASAIFWLSVRTSKWQSSNRTTLGSLCEGLGIALATSSPLRLMLPFSPGYSGVFSASSAEQVRHFANSALALCVDAATFCQGDQDEWIDQRFGRNRGDAWANLVRGLEEWYFSRPQDFQAIVELYPRDGRFSEHEFPTLIFTTGAAIFANQLCHTGMLLLLQNKPRFAVHTGIKASFMSKLWHARRIWGIAMNNDRRECWDPCLIASLFVAARTATHTSQHTAIISAIQQIQQLTGWKVSKHLDDLKNEWRMAEGW